MKKISASILFVSLMCSSAGCSNIVKFAVDKTQPRGIQQEGVVYYVGGAGPVGNIGSFDVPRGLRDAGFRGVVEVVPWQSWTHAGDQLNINRNRLKAAELSEQIQRYRRRHPDAPIHIIALSAGTGIATFALEYLPESIKVDNVAYLGCSMSSEHDMTRALRRVRGKLYVLYSSDDVILKNFVWYTGTVDRKESRDGIAGLEGFHEISSPYPDTERQYRKLVNVPYRLEFRDAGYDGGHVSGTAKTFVQFYVAPALMKSDHRLIGGRRRTPYQPPTYASSPRVVERTTPRQTATRRTRTADDPLRPAGPAVVSGPYTDGAALDGEPAPAAVEGSASSAAWRDPAVGAAPAAAPSDRWADGAEGDAPESDAGERPAATVGDEEAIDG